MGVYYRSALSRGEASIYDRIFEGLISWSYEVPVGDVSMNHAMEMFALVVLDNPELFYVSSSVAARSGGFGGTVLVPTYTMTQAEVNRNWAVIDRRVREFKSQLPSAANDYVKAEIAYEYIIKLSEYGKNPDDQNMCSVLVDEISCCMGYSKSFAYLLSTVGVSAPVITGEASSRRRSGGGHAWNAIQTEGKWSWCDITWGDPVMGGNSDKRLSEVVYDFLCIPRRDLAASHSPDRFVDKLLPACNTYGIDWYSRHHLMFDSFDENVVGKAMQGDVLAREIGFGRDMDGDAYARFTNRAAYELAMERMCRGMATSAILRPVYEAYGYSVSNFSYSTNDDMMTIHVRYDIVKN